MSGPYNLTYMNFLKKGHLLLYIRAQILETA